MFRSSVFCFFGGGPSVSTLVGLPCTGTERKKEVFFSIFPGRDDSISLFLCEIFFYFSSSSDLPIVDIHVLRLSVAVTAKVFHFNFFITRSFF